MRQPRTAASPVAAFVALLGVGGIAAVLAVAARPVSLPPSDIAPVSRQPFVLSDDEALSRFDSLIAESNRAFEDRDLAALPSIYTNDGNAGRLAAGQIRRYIRDGVIDRSTFTTIRERLVSNGPTLIQVRHVFEMHPYVVTEAGDDVTTDKRAILHTALYKLRLQGDRWLIHKAILEKAVVR